MKLTITFDAETWRIRHWWHRTLCDWFGHPGWKTPSRVSAFDYFVMSVDNDKRSRCTRCGIPNPDEPNPPPYVHVFTGLGSGAYYTTLHNESPKDDV